MRKALSRDVDKKSIIPLKHPVRPEDVDWRMWLQALAFLFAVGVLMYALFGKSSIWPVLVYLTVTFMVMVLLQLIMNVFKIGS